MQDGSCDILIRCKQGDQAAFRELVERYQSYGFALAFRLLGNEEDSKDVVQESFIRVWKYLQKFDHEKKFTTWFYKIITNLCYDRIKAKKRYRQRVVQQSEYTVLKVEASDCDIERDIDNQEITNLIRTLACELTPKQHLVFVLRDLQDLNIKEVSMITGLSSGAVKSNLYYARMHIRQRVQQIETRSEKLQ